MPELRAHRFGMTPPPERGGNPGAYEEKVAQWFLEDTFLLDYVYRNPKGKGGKGELADAVVLFGMAAVLVQVKAHFSKRPTKRWAKAKLAEAVAQLKGSHRMLYDGHVTALHHPIFGEVPFNAAEFSSKFGLIILACRGQRFDPLEVCPKLRALGFPVHVLSLSDLIYVVERFDTPVDFLSYLEVREAFARAMRQAVHDEPRIMGTIAENIETFARSRKPEPTEEEVRKTVRVFRRQASGELLRSGELRYGVPFDDMLARIHDRDPELPWARGGSTLESVTRIGVELGLLPRQARIAMARQLGKDMARTRDDGQDRFVAHNRSYRGTALVFLVSTKSREERLDRVKHLAHVALAHYGARRAVGVATEPLGAGRSYDFYMFEGEQDPATRHLLLDDAKGLFRDPPQPLIP